MIEKLKRRFRFTLRALLVVMLLLAVAVWFLSHPQRRAVKVCI